MHQTSDAYKEILGSPHRVETALQIGGEGAVKPCWEIPGTVYGEDTIVSITARADLLNREAPGIGYFISRKIEIEMLGQTRHIEIMGRIVPFSRLVEEESGRTSEWIPKGVFYVDTRKKSMVESDAATITLTCYDAALKAQEEYSAEDAPWPSPDKDVVKNIAKVIGAECDTTNITKSFAISKPDSMTCGEVLGAIAALYGGNFALDDCGVLRLLPLRRGEIVAHLNCQTLKMSTMAAPIESILLHTGSGQKFRAGNGETLESVSQWATQAAVENALNAVNGYRYLAFQAKQTIFHPAIELGDRVVVGAADGVICNYYIDLCNCIGEIGAPEEYEINRNYPYVSPASRGAAKAEKKAMKAVDGVLDLSNGLVAALGAAEGAPENLVAGLKNYVRYDLKNNELMANSALVAKIGEEARGEIRVYAVKSGDTTKTLAEILADQIVLTSAVDDAKAEIELKADEKTVEVLDRRVVEAEKAAVVLTTRMGEAETSLKQKAEVKTVTDLSGRVTKTETAQTEIANRVGNVESGLATKVSTGQLADELKNYALASALKNYLTISSAAELYVTDDDVLATIGAYIVTDKNGNKKTLAEILADQIVLTSAVDDAKAEIELKADEKTVEVLDRRVVEAEKAAVVLTTRMGEAETSLKQKAEVKTVTDLSGRVTKTETAQTEIANRVGNVESGLATKVSTGQLADELKNYALASALKNYLTISSAAELYVTDDDVLATIGAYIVTDKNGNKKTLAEILADQIVLTSAVDDAKAEIELKADEKTVEVLDRRVVEAEKAAVVLTTRMGEAETSLKQKAEVKTVTDLSGRVTKTETAQTEIANRVGNVESGLATKVSTGQLADELKNYALASALKNYLTISSAAELYVTDDDVLATIGAYIVTDKNGNKKTLAEILADQIVLTSAVDDAKAEIELKADEKTVEVLDRRVVEAEKAAVVLTTRMGEAETSLKQKAEVKTVTDLSGRVTKTETAQTEIANRVGNVESGLATKVSTGQLADELKNYALASALKNYLTISSAAELYVTDDDVLATIGAYIVTDKDGNKKTLAEILADQITLQGATKILGNLSVENGKIKSTGGFTTPGDIRSQSLEVADNYVNLGSNTLTLQGDVTMSADGINLGGNIYSPKQITSTTGAVIRALGA